MRSRLVSKVVPRLKETLHICDCQSSLLLGVCLSAQGGIKLLEPRDLMSQKLTQDRTYQVFCTNISSEISKDSAQEICANSTSSIVRNISSDDFLLDLHCFSQKTCPRNGPEKYHYCLKNQQAHDRTLDQKWICKAIKCIDNSTDTFRCGESSCVLCEMSQTPTTTSNISANQSMTYFTSPPHIPTTVKLEPLPVEPKPSSAAVLHSFGAFLNRSKGFGTIQLTQEQVVQVVDNFETNMTNQLSYLRSGTVLSSSILDIKIDEINSTSNETKRIEFGKSSFMIPVGQIERLTSVGKNYKKNLEIKIVAAKWQNVSTNFPTLDQNNLIVPCISNMHCHMYLPANASILSLSYHDTTGQKIQDLPVAFYIDISKDFTEIMASVVNRDPPLTQIELVRECVWWNTTARKWSGYGCEPIYVPPELLHKVMACRCNHTTTFATLLVTRSIYLPRWVYSIATFLEIVTIFFLALSAVLVATAHTSTGIEDANAVTNNEEVRNNRTVSQISLCLAMMGLHLCTVSASTAVQFNSICYSIAVLTHYFLFASALWLLNEGIAMVLKTQDTFSFNLKYKTLTIIQFCLAWIVPLIYVLVIMFSFQSRYIDVSESYKAYLGKQDDHSNISPSSYPKYGRCSISTSVVYYVAIPLVVIIAVNLGLVVRMVYVIYNISRVDNRRRISLTPNSTNSTTASRNMYGRIKKHAHWKNVFRAFCILLPVSSIPWIFLFLQVVRNYEKLFVAINIVVNGTQGILIFYVYCIHSKDNRARVARKWNRSAFGRSLNRILEQFSKKCCPTWKGGKHQTCDIEIRFDNIFPNEENGDRLCSARVSDVTVTTQLPSTD